MMPNRDIREPGTYPAEIDGHAAFEIICHCGAVNFAFADRVNFDSHWTCAVCKGMFIPEPPATVTDEQLFRGLATDLRKSL
jgi:hypothetical protein